MLSIGESLALTLFFIALAASIYVAISGARAKPFNSGAAEKKDRRSPGIDLQGKGEFEERRKDDDVGGEGG